VRGSHRRRAPFDYALLGASLVLLVLGLVMVYSASTIWAEQNMGQPLYFFKRQLVWSVIAVAAMAAVAKLDYNRLREYVAPIYVVTAALLLAALFFRPIAGVRRWIHLGPIGLQPAEFAKLASVIFLASYLDRKHSKLGSPVHGLLIPLGVVGVLLALIGKEPDLGTPVLIFGATVLVLFVAGARVQWIAAAVLGAVPLVAYELYKYPYRRARMLTFLAPFENIKGAGYQLSQSILAVGSGGWFGKGLGGSQLKLLYLPTPHTDFIFPVVCEELGLIGALLVLSLFAVILFGTLLACGVTFTLVLQAFFNVGMAIGLLPTKGIPLPFFSFGGSSLLSTLLGVGLLLSVSRQTRRQEKPA
jgi:cell division protein FtsW